MAHPDRDVEAKIVVLGAQGVGKTALLNRYIHNSFSAELRPTIGANFLTKRLLSPDTHPPTSVRLQIWDTAGQERFRSISKLYYRGADAALLCYDITDRHTFEEMGTWLAEIRKNLGDECLVHVVGTKFDAVQEEPGRRQITYDECIRYVSDNLHAPAAGAGAATAGSAGQAPPGRSLSFSAPLPLTPGVDPRSSGFWGQDTAWDSCHEISAKDGDGVEEVFRVLVRKLVEQRNRRDREADGARGAAAAADDGAAGYFDQRGPGGRGGSFRLGLGNKRKSWLFAGTPGPSTPWTVPGSSAAGGGVEDEPNGGGRCC